MYVAKYSLLGKSNFKPTQLQKTKFTLEFQKSHSKILQPHQTFTYEYYANNTELLKEYWELKGAALFQK